jgi:hypothetical protein
MSTDARPATDATSTANGLAPHADRRSDEDLAREIVEFEKHFPPPDTNAILSDARWFQDHWDKPELTQFRGNFVAVLNGAVVAHGSNALLLELETAKKLNVHPQRFILEYIPRPTF